ncbi:MAG: ketopantoate reductase family protein [Niveispirillum sp.]|uniref:ketopantoate reductase family protein n=1 Tax=Niveispirillum sp. TaxID=1917217 RepID=UPI003BA3E631
MRILILGAGGVGGYFGGRLMEAGANVSFLVRPRRQAQLMENWLRVESPHGNIRVPAQTVTKARKPYDLVLLTCKAWDLDAAIDSVTPAMGPDSILMPLLNGVRHMEVLDRAFGRERVMGGLCHIPITLDEQGVVRHLSTIHKLVFGARHEGQLAAVAALAEAFRPTCVDWHLSDNIMQDLWEKYFFLATLAGSTCLMRGTVGSINRQPGGTDFMKALLAECAAVATAEGYAPRTALLDEYGGQIVDAGSKVNASMARDVAKGGRTEAEHILGDLASRARAHGLATPLLDLALLHLRVHEEGVAAIA